MRSPRLSLRNRLVLRSIEVRAAFTPVDWASAGRAILASTAALGACHPTVHSGVVMADFQGSRPSTTAAPDRRAGTATDET